MPLKNKLKSQVIDQAGPDAVCFWCGRDFYAAGGSLHPMAKTVEHFIPLVFGGGKSLNNCVLAHTICNNDRGARLPTAGEMRRFIELKGKEGRAVIGNAFSKFAKFVREAREALG